MTISLENVGKRFNREWVFRNLTYRFVPAQSVAIIGPNGAGKSTLLQIIAGNLLASEGSVSYARGAALLPEEEWYRQIAFCAPYLDIIEDFTLTEFLQFHFQFKNLVTGVNIHHLPELLQLGHAKEKRIRNFSTGMRQRVKLGICFYSDAPVLLLDEPTTNLDKRGITWYQDEIEKVKGKKLIFVSSNVEREYAFCEEVIDIAGSQN